MTLTVAALPPPAPEPPTETPRPAPPKPTPAPTAKPPLPPPPPSDWARMPFDIWPSVSIVADADGGTTSEPDAVAVDRHRAGRAAAAAEAADGDADARQADRGRRADREAAVAAAAADRLRCDAVRILALRPDRSGAGHNHVRRAARIAAVAADGHRRRAADIVERAGAADGDAEAAVAAAAADRLRKDAVRIVEDSGDVAGARNLDGAGVAAAAAAPADADADADDAAERHDARKAAIAAVAADRLRENAIGVVLHPARGLARARGQIAGRVHDDHGIGRRGDGTAACACAAADAHGDAAGRPERHADSRAAIAAAAAKRLRDDRARLVPGGSDVAVIGEADVRGVAAACSAAADRNRRSDAAQRKRTRSGEAAVAAAAADRLGEKAVRLIALGDDFALTRQRRGSRAIAAARRFRRSPPPRRTRPWSPRGRCSCRRCRRCRRPTGRTRRRRSCRPS